MDHQINRLHKLITYSCMPNTTYGVLVDKIKAKYNSDKYKDRWYKRSIEPPESLYDLLFIHAREYGQKASEEELSIYGSPFTVEIYYYRGYFHEIISGQGTATLIYKAEECLTDPIDRKNFYLQVLRYLEYHLSFNPNHYYKLKHFLKFGFCYLFEHVFKLDAYREGTIEQLLPELHKARKQLFPDNVDNGYWFNQGQWSERIQCLRHAIDTCDRHL